MLEKQNRYSLVIINRISRLTWAIMIYAFPKLEKHRLIWLVNMELRVLSIGIIGLVMENDC